MLEYIYKLAKLEAKSYVAITQKRKCPITFFFTKNE